NHQLNDSTSLIGRVVREAKERRRKWAQNITPRPSKAGKKSQIVIDSEPQQKPKAADGFLPEDIVQMLAARENLKPVILSKIGPPQCSNSALEFLKERKMSVRRSSSVLNNSKRALRLLSRSGVLGRK
ncbi:hypothetical protein V8G54_013860, partial [Vigna mungo]